MSVRHPYDFVPFVRPIDKEEWGERGPVGHERYSELLHSGTLHCVLETKSLLCIKRHFQELKGSSAAPYLPGSSIKGMIRSVAQMLGAGCAGLQFVDFKDMVGPTLDRGLEPCTKVLACLVCRLFGYSTEKEEFGWCGKVRVENSEPLTKWKPEWWQATPGGTARWQSQGTRHRAFYYPSGTKEPAGWKAYRHAKNLTGVAPDFGTDACVAAGERFPFRIVYENLSAEEFAVLQFAVTLRYQCEPHGINVRLAHKLGYGKSVGLGSCEITVSRIEPLETLRYFGKAAPELDHDKCLIEKYLGTGGFKKLSGILSLTKAANSLQFPDYRWFKNPINSSASIADFENYLRTVAPPAPPPTPSPEPTAARLPKRVHVRITNVGNGYIKGVTVEEYGGRKYTCIKGAGALHGVAKDRVCLITVDAKSVDHSAFTFEGRAAWP